MKFLQQSMVCVLSSTLLLSTTAGAAGQQAPPSKGEAAQDANLTPQELDNLVAPIALYPDSLVAQILGAATYPDQITAANGWLKTNSKLKDQALMEAADKQTWDPSVKALTQFPPVLENMAKNLAWTSALGEASYYQQKDVMAAVQRLRKQAKAAGNLKSGEQIKVVQQDPQTIIIQPASPTVVYVPQYNPTVVYGTPYSPPGYNSADLAVTAAISFGVGMLIGAAINNNSCCGWGYGHGGWGCSWHGGTVMYQRNVYVSRSPVYGGGYRAGYGGARPVPYNNRANYNNGNINSGNINNGKVNNGNINSGNRQTNVGKANINTGDTNININTGGNTNVNRPSGSTRPPANSSSREAWRNSGGQGNVNNARPTSSERGYGQRPTASTNSGAFSGYNKGGDVRAESSRGRSSVSGGGGGRTQARTSGRRK
jgi:hypothetical protein